MGNKRNFLNEFSLAFIEELQQGGISFKYPRDKKFIDNEFLHYTDSCSYAMKKIYKLWRTDSDELLSLKSKYENAVGEIKAQFIKNDKSLRFFILKTFHDSCIEELHYDEKNSVLVLKIFYDEVFCKIPYGPNIKLTFSCVEDYNSDIAVECGEINFLISDICYEIENEKIRLYFSGMDINNSFKDCEMCFTYNECEIQ